ncbi:hypothetical protein HAX54_028983 [Datura stramonium]|uniref:Uncharacterized protein n=1 Tax=Datura stramonium TaxID=4076 RepID=A0ABS8V538_DATST|nr:hypothetical protein [Datura stramonium]
MDMNQKLKGRLKEKKTKVVSLEDPQKLQIVHDIWFMRLRTLKEVQDRSNDVEVQIVDAYFLVDLLGLSSEYLASYFGEYLLEDILEAGEDDDDENEEENHIETPSKYPTMISSTPSASVALCVWNHPLRLRSSL